MNGCIPISRFAADMIEAAQQAIAAAHANGVDSIGYRAKQWNDSKDWNGEPLNVSHVATCLVFLTVGPVVELKKVGAASFCGSYTWKHCAERWGNAVGLEPYITNGAFIAAADWLNIPSRSNRGLNVVYALRLLREESDSTGKRLKLLLAQNRQQPHSRQSIRLDGTPA